MSFMFNPYPYHDPDARNPLDASGIPVEQAVFGNPQIAAPLCAAPGGTVIGLDGYTTAPFEVIENLIAQQCNLQGIPLLILHTESLLRPAGELDSMLRERCLPQDRVQDPVLLYGSLFDGEYETLFDPKRLAQLQEDIRRFKGQGEGLCLLAGPGSLCASLRPLCDRTVYADITPLQCMLNLKKGVYKNFGSAQALPFKQLARRCYFVDFELAGAVRGELMGAGGPDWYIEANDPGQLKLLPKGLLQAIFSRALEYPLRCKPVYLEGVWGGYYIQRQRHLPRGMKNCAWVFDFIPMEVSIVFDIGDSSFEFPFYTLVQSEPGRLMGERSVSQFGPYFPVRFNYDDTWHSNGNMSIQCHPDEEYVKRHNNELGRQDESYYIVEAAQGAKTYLGFRDDCDPEQFIAEVKRSERDGQPVDYQKYVYAVDSRPGTQVMIPAGTIHASGRNQLILEIGSLTVGSYTYKMYDYLRQDLDGKPRPIHTWHGERVLRRERRGSWVEENLVNHGGPVASGEDWEEHIVGEHELLYFSLRNIRLHSSAPQDTKGDFHVLALVDGEQVKIRSKKDPSRCFVQNYLEIVVIPADFGEYEILNMKQGTTAVIHKTMLKESLLHGKL